MNMSFAQPQDAVPTMAEDAAAAPVAAQSQAAPNAHLQVLGKCPSCGAADRHLFWDRLTDVVFGVAEGEWTLWRCDGCGAAYLDPRLDEDSIGSAYAKYYTHSTDTPFESVLLVRGPIARRTSRSLRNGYLNAQFGHALKGWTRAGKLLPWFAPDLARRAEHAIRHLPPAKRPARLLDVGCGSGEWLGTAQLLGYDVFGLEPDPAARAVAAANGFEVKTGTLPGSGYENSFFDQVTLNHVFEHLHWPVAALNEVHRMLKPGGRVWITMPNLCALGLLEFGPSWRGLEIPRHLSLYDPHAIQRLLEGCHFSDVTLLPPADNAEFYYRQSVAIRNGRDPYVTDRDPNWDEVSAMKARDADSMARRMPVVGESLTVVGFKKDA